MKQHLLLASICVTLVQPVFAMFQDEIPDNQGDKMPLRKLPDYLILNNPEETNIHVLRRSAQPLTFPLSEEDQESVRILEAKFDQEAGCMRLAAPQIGIGKQIVIFAVPDDPALKKWRSDVVQTMPKTIWINPSYKPLEDNHRRTDYEACFSVQGLAGPVSRFTKIQYEAWNSQGLPVEGVAEGLLARVIQHEVDHLDGRCFIDLVPEGELLSMEEYLRKREAAMQGTSK